MKNTAISPPPSTLPLRKKDTQVCQVYPSVWSSLLEVLLEDNRCRHQATDERVHCALLWLGYFQWQFVWHTAGLLSNPGPNLGEDTSQKTRQQVSSLFPSWSKEDKIYFWESWTCPPSTQIQTVIWKELKKLGCEAVTNFIALDGLGDLYATHRQKVQKKETGAFYTPFWVVQFILDRIGFEDLEHSCFSSVRVCDPAMGSGRFLMAALQRWANHPVQPSPTLYLVGCDVDPVAVQLAQLNGMILATPFLFKASSLKTPGIQFHLSCEDSLQFYQQTQPTTPGTVPKHPLLSESPIDLWIGNPPYLGEKGHKAVFRQLLDTHPAWQSFYCGRMDYAYFFMRLGLDKLQNGGRLGLITTRYWLTAEGAEPLRQAILEHCKILELIEIGPQPIFGDATGQHNLIVLLEKCDSKIARENHFPQWIQVSPSKERGALALESQTPPTISVNKSSIPQGEWLQTIPSLPSKEKKACGWFQVSSQGTIELLRTLEKRSKPLSEVFQDQQGIISGADRLLKKHLPYLSHQANGSSERMIGQGIFCLSSTEVANLNFSQKTRRDLLKPFYKGIHLSPYTLNVTVEKLPHLLYITKDTLIKDYPDAWAHLLPFQPFLEKRRECQSGQIPWYSLHWPRNPSLLEAVAIVTSRRFPHNAFTLAPQGLYENSDLTLLVPEKPEETSYYLGLLNSSLLDFWMAHRGKPKGHQREYFSAPLRKLPLPQDLPTSDLLNAIVLLVQEIQEAIQFLEKQNPLFLRKIWHPHPNRMGSFVPSFLTHPQQYETYRQRWHVIQQKQETLNHLVYRCYQLTSAETRVIEDFYTS